MVGRSNSKSINNLEEDPLNRPENMKQSRIKKIWKKLVDIKENITVELLLAGLITPSIMSLFAMGNLKFEKACRVDKGFDDEICDALIKNASGNYSFYEKEVQKLLSYTDLWKDGIQSVLPCIVLFLLGAWSDKTGKRKICILLPIFGEILTSISNLINVHFFYEIPVLVTVILQTTLTSIFGGWVTILMGVFSYITDITTEESRTFRMGLVVFCMNTRLPIGLRLSSYLLQNIGYYGVFTLTMVLFIAILIYGFKYLKEPDQWLRDKGRSVVVRSRDSNVTFFDFSHVPETIDVAYRFREAEKNLYYMYLRNKLNWDLVKHSHFVYFYFFLHTIGAMFSITVLSRKLKMNDALLCAISVFSKFGSSIWTAFVTTDIEMYLVVVLGVLYASIFTTLRSIISELVEKDETAKINSLFSLAMTFAGLFFYPFYPLTYAKTLSVFPGTVFLISAAFTIPAMIILTIFHIRYKRERRDARNTALEIEEHNEAETKL